MIFIAIGSNLSVPALGAPAEICGKALARLDSMGIRVVARSRFYETAPVPISDQPWFVNAVAMVETVLGPEVLLDGLHQVEREFGRVRQRRNEARVIDLDLIDYNGMVQAGPPILPHPRLTERAFVLLPLRDLAPQWRHPADGTALADLVAALPPGQEIRLLRLGSGLD